MHFGLSEEQAAIRDSVRGFARAADTPKMSQWTDNNLSFLLRDYAEAVGMSPGGIAAAIAPANTGATGYLFPVLAPLLCRAGAVLLEDWGPEAALDLLETERATHAAAIPTR